MPDSQKPLERLNAIIKFIEDTPTTSEFIELATTLVQYVKGVDQRLTADFEQLVGTIKGIGESLKTSAQAQLDTLVSNTKASVEKRLNEAILQSSTRFDSIEKDARAAINYLYDKADSLQSIKGDSGTQGPQGPEGKPGSLPSDEQLLALIKPLIPQAVPAQRVQTPAKVYRSMTADVSSQCNGTNKAFNIGSIHFGIEGVYGTQAPIIYRPIIDYVETPRGITLTSSVTAPDTGQSLIIKYLK